MRKFLFVALLVLLVALAVLLHWYFAADASAPKLRVARETTYITEPVDAEGYLDYQAALNDRLSKGIPPEKNANFLIWKPLRPTAEGGNRIAGGVFKRLGIDQAARDG